jgi:hypothetical protein
LGLDFLKFNFQGSYLGFLRADFWVEGVSSKVKVLKVLFDFQILRLMFKVLGLK